MSVTYALEYGQNALELHPAAFWKGARVLIHDDVLATGGTVEAIGSLIEQLGGEVVGVAFIIDLDLPERPQQACAVRDLLADRVLRSASRCLCCRP